MKIYRGTDSPKIVKPLSNNSENSEDKGLVVPEIHPNPGRPTKEDARSDKIKEIIAEDVITLGAREAAMIHGVTERNASEYAQGDHVAKEVRDRILDRKMMIKDLALGKLLDTVELIDPNNVEKEKDRVAILSGLSQVFERLEDKKDQGGTKVLHLHLYDPGRKKESDYGDVIEVG